MNDHNQDPFAKYDKLFDEQAKEAERNIAKNDAKNRKSFKKIEERTTKTAPITKKSNQPVRVILIVVFSILAFQAIPFIFSTESGVRFSPMFLIMFIIVITNIIIKAFKR